MADFRCTLEFATNNGESLGKIAIKLDTSTQKELCSVFKDSCLESSSESSSRLEGFKVQTLVENKYFVLAWDFDEMFGELPLKNNESVTSPSNKEEEEGEEKTQEMAFGIALIGDKPCFDTSSALIIIWPGFRLDIEHIVFGTVTSGSGVLKKVFASLLGDDKKLLSPISVVKTGVIVRKSASDLPDLKQISEQKDEPKDERSIATSEHETKERNKNAFIGKSGRILKGRGFTYLRHVGHFGGIGYHSETPSPERRCREQRARQREQKREKERRRDSSRERYRERSKYAKRSVRYSPRSPTRREEKPRYRREGKTNENREERRTNENSKVGKENGSYLFGKGDHQSERDSESLKNPETQVMERKSPSSSESNSDANGDNQGLEGEM